MVEQLRALDLERLDDFAGRLSSSELSAIDDALVVVLGL
jgi:mRNA-degrading endonuclease toxin of MazEF toxin-antitoxin module